METILDRLRIPTFFGAGAKRLDKLFDTTALPPILVIPLWLQLSSYHPLVTLLLFLLIPLCILVYFVLVLRHRRRTQFFMSWGLMSTLYIYYVFIYYVLPLDQVGAAQIAGVSMIFVAMLAAFFASKHGPGVISNLYGKGKGEASKDWFRVSAAGAVDDDEINRVRSDSLQRRLNTGDSIDPVVNGVVLTAVPAYDDSHECDDKSFSNSPVRQPLQHSDEWCKQCQLQRPQRAGHCPICQHCVLRLDHHCVWIDSCIGEENHRSFLLAVLFFVLGSYWGSFLAFNSLFPMWTSVLPDVLNVYQDSRSAVIFVSICYALLAASFMSALLMVQFHNITHNWTSRERRILSRRPEYRERLVEQDEGLCQNWMNFIIMQRSVLRKNSTQYV
ncbi:palmitoyltransferase ZDHHC23-like isoform X2 [Amphiura filiformis]